MADSTTPQAAPATARPGGSGVQGQGQGGRGNDNRRSQRRDDRPVEEKQFDERTLHIDRVARVVKGGRRFRFRALVVVGDKKKKVGIGMAKGADVTAAITKATEVAKKHMISVSLYKGTLPHEVETKVSGAHILLKPASAGTGLIAGGVIRTILEVAGVKNVLSKSLGSSNKANTAYATIKALELMVPSSQWVTSVPKPKKAAPKAEKVEA
jgi:small subunit ribosomal protein S5